MSSNELAVVEAAATDLTLAPDQRDFTPAQIAALAQIGLENVPDGDRQVFFHQSKRTGLDPFAKQIYMIGRNAEVDVEETNPDTGNTRKVKKYVTRYTIQIGIDGYRLLTRRAADANGDTLGMEGPLWCDDDGVWRDVWPEGKPPTAAKFILFRNGEPFPFVAHYSEYVQTNRSGEPNSMWKKMPRNQLAKCAEVGACRRAYPADFSGLVFSEAAVIDQEGNTIQDAPRAPTRARGVGKLRERAKAARGEDPVDVEVVDDAERYAEQHLTGPDAAAYVSGQRPPAEGEPPNGYVAPEPTPDIKPAPPEVEPEKVTPPPPPATPPAEPAAQPDDGALSPDARRKGLDMMAALFIGGGATDLVERAEVMSEIVAKMPDATFRALKNADQLTDVELKHVVDTLRSAKAANKLQDYVAEAANMAAIRAAGLEGS